MLWALPRYIILIVLTSNKLVLSNDSVSKLDLTPSFPKILTTEIVLIVLLCFKTSCIEFGNPTHK